MPPIMPQARIIEKTGRVIHESAIVSDAVSVPRNFSINRPTESMDERPRVGHTHSFDAQAASSIRFIIAGDYVHHEIDSRSDFRHSDHDAAWRRSGPAPASRSPMRRIGNLRAGVPADRPPVSESGGEIKAVTQAILDEIDKRSELMDNIEYLCDMIGPRLTGSPNLTKANKWTRDKFQQYGLAKPHLESWTIGRAWTRGNAKGAWWCRSNSASFWSRPAGAPRPRAPSAGRSIHVKAESTAELCSYKGKLNRAWIVLSEVSVQPTPSSLCRP